MPAFEELLYQSAVLHQHLCPRQVLGVRMGLAGGRWLGLDVPQIDKRLLAIVETDGCLIDGLAVATGCRVGRRTMRVLDFGKVAATFVDTQTGRAVRITPSASTRHRAKVYARKRPVGGKPTCWATNACPRRNCLRFEKSSWTCPWRKF